MSVEPSPTSQLTPAKAAAATGAVLSLGAALVGAAPANAGPPAAFNVTNTNDSGDGSLRDAIDDANGQAGADSITFQAGLGTITVPTEIAITDELTITGPATLMGDGDNRIFYIDSATAVTITGLTLSGGDVEGNGGAILSSDTDITIQQSTISGNAAREDDSSNYGDGGGVYLDGGDFTITDTVFSGNTAEGSGGGAFFNGDTEGTALSISGSTFDDNSADYYGGGLAINHLYDNTIDTTTISNNTAAKDGGGLYMHTHLDDGPTPNIVITSSTISGNYAAYTGGGLTLDDTNFNISHSTIVDNEATYGGGLYVTNFDTGVLDHVIVGNNTSDAAEDNDIGSDDGEDEIAVSFSLITAPPADAVWEDVEGNIVGEDPGVGILADNGGPNRTHALAETSAALDGGDPGFAPPPATDQRGESRVEGDAIDIGAYEAQPEEPAPPAEPPAAQPAGADPDFTG